MTYHFVKRTSASILFISSVLFSASAANPEVDAEGIATFRYRNDKADEVAITGSFLPRRTYLRTDGLNIGKEGRATLTKGVDGKWIYVSAPLEPDMYTYRFEVDGEKFYDPSNKLTVRETADTLNYFFVKGGVADKYMDQKVSHGEVKKVWYPSSLNGMKKRRMSVYLPPQYKKDTSRRFPVLYLLHGSGGDEDSWLQNGRAAQILDNMIAEGECEPMIVVMTNGNVELAAAPGADPANPDVQPSGNNTSSMFGSFEASFVPEVVDYVDSNFRTKATRDNRAIAGLSMGGLHTLYITLNNPDKFNYIGLFSAQTTNALNNGRIRNMKRLGDTWRDLKASIPILGGKGLDKKIERYTSENLSVYDNMDEKLSALFAAKPTLYYIAIGKDDFLKKLNDDYRRKLDSGNYTYVYHETEGGHTWSNWRKYLVDFLPQLF